MLRMMCNAGWSSCSCTWRSSWPSPVQRKIILPSLAGLCSFSRSSGKRTVGVGVTPLRCLPGGLWGGLRSFPQCLAPQRFCSPRITLGKPVLKSGCGNGDLSATLGKGENLTPAASPWHLVVATASHAPSCPHTRTHPPQTSTHAGTRTPTHTASHTHGVKTAISPQEGVRLPYLVSFHLPLGSCHGRRRYCAHSPSDQRSAYGGRQTFITFLLAIMFCWKPATLIRLSGICLCFWASRAEMSNRSRDHVVLRA